ncbi:MAG: FAD-dependent oxidoreductase, partial [Chitinophagaceae bacterium]|nr:FAD-dependent oxidoreductase [Anaerolineae bacterium]
MQHTLIIGAGAAGLAAGRVLHDSGHDILILEARDRIGGRAWTDHTFADFPIELGAEFIHGEHAATHQLVKDAGFHTIPVVRMDHLWWAENGHPAVNRNQLPAPIREIIDGLLRDYDALANFALANDMSLADYLRGRGWDDDALKTADVLLAQTCCATIETLSCADLIREAHADHAGSQEFRIEEGYAALFDHYSRDVPIQLNKVVSAIYWDAEGVTVM